MSTELTGEEREALIDLLTDKIQSSKYPLSPRIQRWRRIRGKVKASVAAQPKARLKSR